MQMMKSLASIKSVSPLDACEYLQALQALARELDRAMEAIVAGELTTFEESVQTQRSTCDKLAELTARSAARPIPASHLATPSLDPDMAIRIDGAARTLHTLNQRYSALLKHSGNTIRLLASLYRTYSGPTPMPAIQTDLRTWSCEG